MNPRESYWLAYTHRCYKMHGGIFIGDWSVIVAEGVSITLPAQPYVASTRVLQTYLVPATAPINLTWHQQVSGLWLRASYWPTGVFQILQKQGDFWDCWPTVLLLVQIAGSANNCQHKGTFLWRTAPHYQYCCGYRKLLPGKRRRALSSGSSITWWNIPLRWPLMPTLYSLNRRRTPSRVGPGSRD